MNTKVLALLSVFMLIFSLVVFFNRNVEGFDKVDDSYDCIDQQIPSKCRLLHSFWIDYYSKVKDSYQSGLADLVKCSTEPDHVVADKRIKTVLHLLNQQHATENYKQYTCEKWRSLLDTAATTLDPNLQPKVNALEKELLDLVTKGKSVSDVDLTDNVNIDEAKEFLQSYCDKKDDAGKYSSADVIKALWCKLSCGRPGFELENLNALKY